ncbi:hypothetical protein GCM10027073_08040 [Streptomyces chlorus]
MEPFDSFDGLFDGSAVAEAEEPAEGLDDGLDDGLGAARATGAVSAVDKNMAEVTSSERRMEFLGAGTVGNVHAVPAEVPTPSPPRERNRTPAGDTGPMPCPPGGPPPEPRPNPGARRCDERSDLVKLSRPVSWFLLAFGVWSWIIWVTFVKNLVKDGSGLAFDDGEPTAYFWVHLLLAVVSFVLGTVVGGIGLRGLRALSRTSRTS